MSFVMTSVDLRQVADFLEGLRDLYEKTGVRISHYERVEIAVRSGEVLHLLPGMGPDLPTYRIEERDSS